MKEQRKVLLRQMHETWVPVMEPIIMDGSFDVIWRQMNIDAGRLAPHPSRVFRVLQMPIPDIRVIIVGQDPYINKEAEGYAFSSATYMTPSLRSIFKEIALTEGRYRTNPSLKDWVDQGVFLINTNLTTVERVSLAHDKIGWPWVTGHILRTISDTKQEPFVIMAWGNHAKNIIKQTIKINDQRLLLQHVHPAARFQEFTGCGHFRAANEFLSKHGLPEINWCGKEGTLVD